MAVPLSLSFPPFMPVEVLGQSPLNGLQGREVSKRLDTGKEEVGTATYGGECWKAGDLFSDGAFGDFEFERTVVVAYDWVALVAELMEVVVVHPHVLRKLELPDEARTDH